MSDVRITYQILIDDEEVGFGSTCTWSSIDAAVYEIESTVGRGEWETEGGQPSCEEVMASLGAAR